MGTNFYLTTTDRTMAELLFDVDYSADIYEFHIAKTSAGWLPLLQSWKCFRSVEELKKVYDIGVFTIIDEYNTSYTWEEFTERVLNFNKNNPDACSHLSFPKNRTKQEIYEIYGSDFIPLFYNADKDGYEFSDREFS